MHKSSYDLMESFIKEHLLENQVVLDVGGSYVNGSYKEIIVNNNSIYRTLDWNNSDYIVKGYDWSEVPEKHFDVVISGQMLEHDGYFWKTLENIKKVVKPNGLVIIIVPSKCHFHQYPLDCYRFYPDSALIFAEILNADIIKVVWNNEHAVQACNDKMSGDIKSIIFEYQSDNAAGDLGMVFRIK